jgi:hypothetical protein
VIYNRYNVAIVGSIPVRTESGESKLPFRIEGKIDIAAIRSSSCRRAALAAMQSTVSPSDTSAGDRSEYPTSIRQKTHTDSVDTLVRLRRRSADVTPIRRLSPSASSP